MRRYVYFFFLSLLVFCHIGFAYKYQLGANCIFRDSAYLLREWIEYHRMVGVEHFWLYNNKSTDNYKEVLQPYIEEGLVELFDWNPTSRRGLNHVLANQHTLKRALNNTKWVACIDIDEFLFPIHEKTVIECLEKHFLHASAVYVSWRCFGTGGKYLSENDSRLFNLTAINDKGDNFNVQGKSIVRPEHAILDKMLSQHHVPLKTDNNKFLNGDALPHMLGKNNDWWPIGHYDKYIRINHYNLGDENHFHKTRLPRETGTVTLQWEHRFTFSKENNYDIINFICEKHPEMYEKFWKKYYNLGFKK